MLKQQASFFNKMNIITDSLVVVLAFLAAYFSVAHYRGNLGPLLEYAWVLLFAVPLLVVMLQWKGFYSSIRRVSVYEIFVEGAKEGFQVAVRIIPYLVAILVAVGMFRASGAMDIMVRWLSIVTGKIGMPAEALPMALMRPLSGSGAYGILASIINDPSIGPDSYVGYLVSTLQGSTETTFYVLAVYFGAVQVRRLRHTLASALTADLAGIVAAVAICSYLYGS